MARGNSPAMEKVYISLVILESWLKGDIQSKEGVGRVGKAFTGKEETLKSISLLSRNQINDLGRFSFSI